MNTIHEKLKMRDNKKNISISFILLYYFLFFIFYILKLNIIFYKKKSV